MLVHSVLRFSPERMLLNDIYSCTLEKNPLFVLFVLMQLAKSLSLNSMLLEPIQKWFYRIKTPLKITLYVNLIVFSLQIVLQTDPLKIGVKQFACPLCSKIFGSSGDCRRHIKIHIGDKPFQCQICDYATHEKHKLTRHLKKHQPKEEIPDFNDSLNFWLYVEWYNICK